MERPLLSICVPTKDRYYYLKYLIDLIATFNSSEVELVIQDNTVDNSEILEFINSGDYSFVNYNHRIDQVSMSYNCDLSILNSHGEYVCVIGDDDGVTRLIVDCVKWMKKNDFKILKSSYAIYKWPSFKCPSYYPVKATAIANPPTFTYRIESCKKALKRLLISGIHTLQYMPKTYNGITRRDVLDRVYDKLGTFHPGPSPDIANAVSIALEEDSYVFLDAPIIIGGHSSNMGGGANKYKHQFGTLEDQAIIDKKDVEAWDNQIPKIWAAQAVWPESALTALKAYNAEEFLNIYDFENVYKVFMIEHPQIAKMAFDKSKNKPMLFVNAFFYYLYRRSLGAIHVLQYKLFGEYARMKVNRNVQTIVEAEEVFVKGRTFGEPEMKR